ncbi:MAG: PEP-CTERM sorting domain-containing protein [Verrucomicrobia bacterium]|nr:PEP-CTERM sorting domain-containing protein [Verrucomicrobiota bacterium]
MFDDLSFSPLPVVPEPANWALLGLGGAALGWVTRRRS